MKFPPISQVMSDGPALARAYWYFRHATRLGSRVRVWGSPIVRNEGKLIVGDRVRVVSLAATVELSAGEGALLELGEGTYVNNGCSIGATLSVRIGPNCSIGSHTTIIDNAFHSLEPERRNEMPPSEPIVLEENVWLGIRVIVLRGVTIGAGSVVGAGSIVTKDIPPRSLALGMPAKVVRSL